MELSKFRERGVFSTRKKAVKVMKITAFILLVGCLQVSAYTKAQVKIDVKNMALEKVLDEVANQASVYILYNAADLSGMRVSATFQNVSVETALNIILKGHGLTYAIDGKNIVIQRTKKITLNEKQILLPDSLINIQGQVLGGDNKSVAGATVTIKGSDIATSTQADGSFSLSGVKRNAALLITSVGYEPKIVQVNGKSSIVVQLSVSAQQMKEVTIVNSGYEKISPERATGSYSSVNNEMLNRRVSANILDRIENLSPGVSFRNANDGILIRGRSSIFSNVNPLIVVDNFPYDGDINNINPNDIENITILKDAGAASIWGARAGNGVIVITTKRGKTQKPTVEINSNVTIQKKPNLQKLPVISSADFIGLERDLFQRGLYDGILSQTDAPAPLTPVVEILVKVRSGELTQAQGDEIIKKFEQQDARNDVQKYFYRNPVRLQNSINVSGNSNSINYFLSMGYDRALPELVGATNDRVTLRTVNTFKVLRNFQIEAGAYLTQTINKSGNNLGYSISSGAGKSLYPYADLVDDLGSSLALVKDFRQPFTDTIGKGVLNDWQYKPYDEIGFASNQYNDKTQQANITLRYNFRSKLTAEVLYQYLTSTIISSSLSSKESYYVRDLVNRFYQPFANIKFPVPYGGILNNTLSEIISHQGRAQLSYNNSWKRHDVSVIAGWEIKNLVNRGNVNTQYGYNEMGSTVNPNMDFVTQFPQFVYIGSNARIPNIQSVSKTLDRFISYYANASYTFDRRITVSASGRQDAANLFGVETNQRGVPLWSAGVSWLLSNEKFYNFPLIPLLKIRSTYGNSGNYSRSAKGLLSMAYDGYNNSVGLPTATILNPSNKKLRWEQVGMFNIGIDFESKNNIVSGSIDYFRRHSKDLIASTPANPTLGVIYGYNNYYFANVASVKGNGLEFQINIKNIDNKFRWTTNYIFSYNLMKVSEYLISASENTVLYLSEGTINPLIGYPAYSVFSYRWAGLDSITGSPIGYLGKNTSQAYSDIINKTKIDSLKYHGPLQPKYFGSIINTFQYKGFQLSINISYKLGYFFRRNSINYASLIQTWTGHNDYAQRWRKSGDERSTSVPSFQFPPDPNRDFFYAKSEVLVEKGDHIRLDDIQLRYNLDLSSRRSLPFNNITFYVNATNLGPLWLANKEKIDPYFNGGIVPGKMFSFGLNVGF
ncbi:SusC/RagA family TonB-linked outer membrane protein [Pseudoflavitalea rhizosphaerae]|uniref:SusC/RagA family TonB-linked outer membrane protein n=1 Tax=Pseudoflavitalea rhizosphaerae TaxID=1884793 RepID=UPI0013E072D9|nr:SusC/RagA family TonB-linked outer membrane protein [Pseudoflavitalea rhizosphaerae]